MRKAIALFSVVLLSVSLAAPVGAANDTNDVEIEFGPTVPGKSFVQSNDVGDEVRLVVKLWKTRPDQSLYVEVWCGPTHLLAGDLVYYGYMTTNGQGNGNTGEIYVDMSSCGSGELTGHVDVGGFSSTTFELTSQFAYSNP